MNDVVRGSSVIVSHNNQATGHTLEHDVAKGFGLARK